MAMRRGVRLVMWLIGSAIFVSVAGVGLLYVMVSRGPTVPQAATLVLRPGGQIAETVPNDVVGQFLGRGTNTVRAFVDNLRKAKRDARITSVLIMPSSLELPYWAKVQELRDAIADFRRSGKKVTAFLEYGGDREYFLASAADRVYLLPTSPLDLTGVASYEVFLRGTLDKIGVYPDFLHIGDYKTATNQLTEKSMTPAHREMTEALNRDMFDQLVRGIAQGRRKSEADVRALIRRGPLLPQEAVTAGLVDGLAYEDQLDDRVPELRTQSGQMKRIDDTDYSRIDPQSVGIRPRSRIAVLYAVGTIASGKSAFDPLNGSIVGSDTLVEQIRHVRDDDSIKAIVLRVDSPGGSSVASDVIWRELMITRDQKPSRPLITSMSDLAASGGYYISLPGQTIVAQPGTLTGSIGIYTGKMVLAGTLDKIGVTQETVTSGGNADIYSPFAKFTPEERARVAAFLQDFYGNFLDKVAASRHSTREQIDRIARGRVWTGAQAREHGLVDMLGGLDAAIAIAKQQAKIPADEDVELVSYPARRSFYDAITEPFRGEASFGLWSMLTGASEARALAALTAPARLFRRGEPLALMPYTFLR
jgi:protease IV